MLKSQQPFLTQLRNVTVHFWWKSQIKSYPKSYYQTNILTKLKANPKDIQEAVYQTSPLSYRRGLKKCFMVVRSGDVQN